MSSKSVLLKKYVCSFQKGAEIDTHLGLDKISFCLIQQNIFWRAQGLPHRSIKTTYIESIMPRYSQAAMVHVMSLKNQFYSLVMLV